MSKLANIINKTTVTNYAQSAAQGAMDLLAVASFLAPLVLVGTMSGFYKIFNQKHRFRIPNTKRSLNGTATRIGFDAKDGTFKLALNALDFPVDDAEQEDEAALTDLVNEGSDMVAEVAALAHEKEVVDLGLEALGAGTDASFVDAIDPIKFLDEKILAVLKSAKCGSLIKIRLLIGADAWLIIKNHPKVTGKITGNAKGAEKLQVTEDILSSMLITHPEIKVVYSIYDDAPEGIDETIKFILSTNIVIFACKPNPTRLDPSFMKTFVKRGAFMVPGMYRERDDRGDVVKYDWNCMPAITNEDAGLLLNVSDE